jgi:hypothetical protein
LSQFDFGRLPEATRTRIETYAREAGISISEAVESVVLEAISREGLNRAFKQMDEELEKVRPKLRLVKPLALEEES